MSTETFTYGLMDEAGAVTFKINRQLNKVTVVPEGDGDGDTSFNLSAVQVRSLAKKLNNFADKLDKNKKLSISKK